MLDAVADDAKLKDTEKLEKLIRTACHKSIKAGDAVSLPEIERLLTDLFLCRAPYTCPHGRPTVSNSPGKNLKNIRPLTQINRRGDHEKDRVCLDHNYTCRRFCIRAAPLPVKITTSPEDTEYLRG